MKMLVTWASPLNLTKVSSIFSVCPCSVLPTVCSLLGSDMPFVTGRLSPPTHTHKHTPQQYQYRCSSCTTSSTCGCLTDYRPAEAFWDIKRSAKHADLLRHVEGGPHCLLVLRSRVTTETSFHWKCEERFMMCWPSAILNTAKQQHFGKCCTFQFIYRFVKSIFYEIELPFMIYAFYNCYTAQS